jgi:hypothetical protein
MEKELENPEKKEKRKQPSRPTKPSLATRPRRQTGRPRLSAAVPPSRALSLSLALCPLGPIRRCQFSFARALSFSLCLADQDCQSLSRCPHALILSPCAMGQPCQFRLLRARRGPSRAHSRTSPGFSATTPAHAPSSLYRAMPVSCAHRSPHFAQLHPLSCSALAASRRRRPAPAPPAILLAGDRPKPPRSLPQGETPVPVPNFPYCALCSSNFAFASAQLRRSAVLARWPAVSARSSSPE